MTLKGDLDSISLADVFQTLSMTQQEGTLVVQNPEQKKCIYFSRQGVSLVTTGEKKGGKLGDLLMGLGKINGDQLTEALDVHKERSMRLGEALIELGYVTQEDIEGAVRQQIEEEIYDLFSWENASFEFLEGPPHEGVFSDEGLPITKLTFNVNALIMEAARRIDEWELIEKFIPTMKEFFVPSERLDTTGLSEQEQFILQLLDGSRNVVDVVRESHIPKFDVCKFLYRLLEDNKARRVDFESLIGFGDEAVKNETLEDAVKFYEQAVEAKVKKRSDQVKARMRLAQALEYGNRKKEAAVHYKILAEQKLEEDDVESAISIWHKVIDFDPLDLENKERLINLYLENRHRLDSSKSDMIQQIELQLFKNGRSLAMAFSYAGQTERAQEVLNRLIELAPSNVELRKSLVNIYYDSGDKQGAVAELEQIVHFLLASHDYESLVDIYRHMLKIDPSRSDVRKKISMIEEGEVIYPRGKKRLLKLVLALVGLLLLGGAGAVIYYQIQAMKKWEKVQAEADDLWKKNERQKAKDLLRSLRSELPFTIVLGKIDDKLEDFDTQERMEKDKEDQNLHAEIDSAKVEYERIYKQLHNTNTPLDDETLVRQINETIASIQGNKYAGDLPEKLAREKEWIAQEIERIRKIFEQAMEIEKQAKATGEYDVYIPEAWVQWLRLYEEGGRVPTYHRQVRLPVRVATVPPGAEAVVNGKKRYVTPFDHYKKPGDKITIHLSRRGYEDEFVEMMVEDLRNFEPSPKQCTVLQKLAIRRLFAPSTFKGNVYTPPAVVGETLFIATMATGKVFAFREGEKDDLYPVLRGHKPSSHTLNWGFDTRAAVDGERIFLACQDGRIYGYLAREAASQIKPLTLVYDTGIGPTGKIAVEGGGVAVDGENRRLFVATTRGLYAFDLDSGNRAWRFPSEEPLGSTPVIHEGIVVFGGGDASLCALPVLPQNPEEVITKPLWKVKLPAPVTTVPCIRGETVIVGAGDALYGISLADIRADDPATWRTRGTPLRTGGTIRGPLAVGESELCFSSQDGYLYCVGMSDLSKAKWKFNAGAFRSNKRHKISPPVIVGDSVFLGTHGGRFFSVDVRTGNVNWFRELEGRIVYAPAATDSGTVFVVSQKEEQVYIHGYKE
jgi:outer membrane protein assembly factor BamB/tetratricopeptide (TPR) repeat protein